MRKTLAAAALLAVSLGIGAAAPAAGPARDIAGLDPEVMKSIIPDRIPWEVTPGLDTAYLYGHPSKEGFYVLLFKWKPGNASHPHYHSQDRHIVVMSGTWWVGDTTNWDLERDTAPIKPGTYVTHYARHVHYDGARAGGEPAVELVWGMGPVATVVCDSPNGAKDTVCEEARKKTGNR